jgi:hypothetical protein
LDTVGATKPNNNAIVIDEKLRPTYLFLDTNRGTFTTAKKERIGSDEINRFITKCSSNFWNKSRRV